MTFFDNKERHLLPPDQELTFLSILSECERKADYFTPETYKYRYLEFFLVLWCFVYR